jgi:L-alanine-DL-glutamate epimerase-like enolase superfamily enzyme
MRFRVSRHDWEFKSAFRIAYRTRTHAQTVRVELEDSSCRLGRGEALGVSYHGETADRLVAELSALGSDLRNDLTRDDLRTLLAPGGARNALDCAFWDLEAKRANRRAWELAGVSDARPILTSYTLGADKPEAMADAAGAVAQYSRLKLKLTGDRDIECVARVRAARPDADLIVDANQAWTVQQLREFAPQLADLRVMLIEQPLPAGQDAALEDFSSPIPLCADESCQTSESIPLLLGKYAYVNIKLDKTGGLTEALHLARIARTTGLKLMVGCMGGSSLSMAPAFVVGQFCELADLDGPLLCTADVPHPIHYERDFLLSPGQALWG